MPGEVVRACLCCDSAPPNVDFLRVSQGLVYQRGFPALMNFGPPAGRYILSGWTGVTTALAAHPRDNLGVLRAIDYTEGLLAWHKTNQRVRRRSGADGATVATYNIPETTPGDVAWTSAIPPAGPWALAGADGDSINTYIATAFWRNGVHDFAAGDIVYRCTPNALETDDDWQYEPYLCTHAIVSAGDPAFDPAHFTSLITGAGHATDVLPAENELWGQVALGQFITSAVAAVVAEAGHAIPVGTGHRRVLTTFAFSEPPEAPEQFTEPISLVRPLAAAEPRLNNPQTCRIGPVPRYLSMRQSTELTGDNVTNGGGAQTFTLAADSIPQFSQVDVQQEFTGIDQVFGAPSLPAIGAIVATYTRDYDVNGTLYAVSGGGYPGGGLTNNGNPPTFHAGDRYKIVDVFHNFDTSVNHSEEHTYTVLVPEITADLPAGYEGAPVFSAEPRAARLSYPVLPQITAVAGTAPVADRFNNPDTNPYLTIVRGIRFRSLVMGEASNVFTWDLLLVPYTLRASDAAGAVLARNDKIIKATLTQRITLSDLDTQATALARMTTQITESVGAPALPSAGSFYNISGPHGFFTGEGFGIRRVLRFFMAGPQTASLRNYFCNVLLGCVNIPVPAAGLLYNIADSAEQEARQVTTRRACA